MNPTYYIFFEREEFLKELKLLKEDGYHWINAYDDWIPNLKDSEFPIVLNCDKNKTMMHSIIENHKEHYFSDKKFVKIYNYYLRKYKIAHLYE